MCDTRFTDVISFSRARDFVEYLRASKKHWGETTECEWFFRGHHDVRWDLIPSAWRPEGENRLRPLVKQVSDWNDQYEWREFQNDDERRRRLRRSAGRSARCMICARPMEHGWRVSCRCTNSSGTWVIRRARQRRSITPSRPKRARTQCGARTSSERRCDWRANRMGLESSTLDLQGERVSHRRALLSWHQPATIGESAQNPHGACRSRLRLLRKSAQ